MIATAAIFFLVVVALLIFEMPRFAATDSVRPLITAASRQDLDSLPVLCLNTLSHNSEFYAQDRLLRDQDGKQHRFADTAEIRQFLQTQEPEHKALVIVPLQTLPQLTSDQTLISRPIDENTELAIVLVEAK